MHVNSELQVRSIYARFFFCGVHNNFIKYMELKCEWDKKSTNSFAVEPVSQYDKDITILLLSNFMLVLVFVYSIYV